MATKVKKGPKREKTLGAAFEDAARAARVPTVTEMAQLYAQLGEATKLKEQVAQMEADLAAAKSAYHELRTTTIPRTMLDLEMPNLTWRDYAISIEDFVNGSLPKDPKMREKAIAWLDSVGGGELITTDVGVKFPRTQRKEALKVAKRLEKLGWTPNVSSGVHAQTYQAFARERLREGKDVPADIGLFVGKVAKIEAVA